MNRAEYDVDGVMARLDWLNILSEVFHEGNSQSLFIYKSNLLTRLSLRQPSLKLSPLSAYLESKRPKPFSFKEVYNALYQVPMQKITWDELMDAVLRIEPWAASKTGPDLLIPHSECSEALVLSFSQSSVKSERSQRSLSSETNQKTQRHFGTKTNSRTVSIPNDPARITVMKFSSTLLYLNLSGNKLTELAVNFPSSLIALNLRANEIRHLKFHTKLPNLKFLNVNENRLFQILNLTAVNGLTELYASRNSLGTATEVCVCQSLQVLDLAHNKLDSLESIAGISTLRLVCLRLKDNPVASHPDYRHHVMNLVPSLCLVDTNDLVECSEFKDLRTLLFEVTMQPQTQRIQKRKISLEINQPLQPQRSLTPRKEIKTGPKRAIGHSTEGEDVMNLLSAVESKLSCTDRLSESFNSQSRKKYIVTNETIRDKSVYGNPISSVMVKPPPTTIGKAPVAKKRRHSSTLEGKPFVKIQLSRREERSRK